MKSKKYRVCLAGLMTAVLLVVCVFLVHAMKKNAAPVEGVLVKNMEEPAYGGGHWA